MTRRTSQRHNKFSLSFVRGAVAFAIALGCSLPAELVGPDGDGKDDNSDSSTDDNRPGGSGNIDDSDDGLTLDDGTGGGDNPNGRDSVCGNGVLEEGEVCDDGNTKGGDGCSRDCKEVDPNYVCLEEGEDCIRVVTCGNGVIEGTEVCDDKNTKSDDGCSAKCDKVEEGYSCVKPGEPCVELPVCGNGIRERGEQCDDGEEDPKSGDGCSETCQQEEGFFCPPGQACVEIICGDGFRTPDESCDDNNVNNGDGCSSNCEVETGWYCSASGCKPICGDGLIRGNEACDDNDRESGDGCSSACRVEPFYECDNSSGTSVCTSTIECGNGILEPGEICDPGIMGQSDCYSVAQNPAQACKAFRTILPEPVCGNGVIELEEECDGDQGNGGCVNCVVTDGFACPKAGTCVRLPRCGDGFLQAGEQCDPGAMSTMGCTDCQINNNYFCSGQPSVCVVSVCGDGVRAPNEQCDDPRRCVGGANAGTICSSNANCPGSTCAPQPASGDGCSSSCTIETGYICPPNANCLAICGDGIRTGNEECDSSDTNGCRNCRLQPGYMCGANGTTSPCTRSTCGNGTTEAGEGCDDGNAIAGDGCGPTCQIEPTFTRTGPDFVPTASSVCGDGLKTGGESCDDGNTTSGDGCSATCSTESGWYCEDNTTYPSFVDFRVTYRDFKAVGQKPTGATSPVPADLAGAHPDFQSVNSNYGYFAGLPGPVCTAAAAGRCTTAAGANCGADTCGWLDGDGKPVLHNTNASNAPGGVTSANSFGLWYRNSNTTGVQAPGGGSSTEVQAIPGVLRLNRVGTTGDRYSAESSAFFPINGQGFGNYPNVASPNVSANNFHFTTELRYFFKYKGGETLAFRGDDDVFVFVNGRLAVDIGGVHGALHGRVTLGDDDSSCTVNGGSTEPGACALSGAETSDLADPRFGLTVGNVYEIVLFHAERRTTESNFRLTLEGFIAPRSTCNTTCGDGIRAGSEVCDTGNGTPNGGGMPSSGYNTCLYIGANNPNNCTYQFCGDGIQNGNEYCDNGLNIDTYGSGAGRCAPGCLQPARCGDGTVQPAEGEECDLGTAGNNGAYGGCTAQCKFAPYCGDKVVQAGNGETCDPANGVFGTYGQGVCGYDCKAAPFCGDNVRNGPELCDGSMNCNLNCEFDPFCGDGLKTMNEDCDYGSFNQSPAPYGGCTTMCEFGPRCGDDTIQANAGEECDDGPDNVNGEYDRCTLDCLLGPNCGDGVHQAEFGEACDNGFNEDVYAYPGSSGACGVDCKGVPFCGDGRVQGAYELCDNGSNNNDNAYNGCTTKCDWGPYCGDGVKNGSEKCDHGPNNVAYSKDGKGCSYECTDDVPYCGDGVRNGPELCDLGTAGNTGKYGTCKPDCTPAPRCGDGKIQRSDGEECDDGPTGSFRCSPFCKTRSIIK